MTKLIKRYYLTQLIVGLVFTVLLINLMGILNQIDDYSKGRLLIMSIVGGLLYTLLNGLINALNFSYPKRQNNSIAFYLPILIWTIPLIIAISEMVESRGTKITDWLLILIWVEPMIYNLIIKKSSCQQLSINKLK
ncbi:hypothetical protein [Brumimicrobium aurantiacum]|nr:hypothetical protein [Brumimicrobium aurantiacum]